MREWKKKGVESGWGASGQVELHLGPGQEEVKGVADDDGDLVLASRVAIHRHCKHRVVQLHANPLVHSCNERSVVCARACVCVLFVCVCVCGMELVGWGCGYHWC